VHREDRNPAELLPQLITLASSENALRMLAIAANESAARLECRQVDPRRCKGFQVRGLMRSRRIRFMAASALAVAVERFSARASGARGALGASAGSPLDASRLLVDDAVAACRPSELSMPPILVRSRLLHSRLLFQKDCEGYDWISAYSLLRHGASTQYAFAASRAFSHSLMVILDSVGSVFGGF